MTGSSTAAGHARARGARMGVRGRMRKPARAAHARNDDARDGGMEPGLAWLAGMWSVMMVAMMLPSAAPTILLFATVSRRRRPEGGRPCRPRCSPLGYLLVWTLYAAAAAGVQWELHRRALLSPAMASASPAPGRRPARGGGALSVAAVQGRLPLALPLAARVLLGRVARRSTGGAADGHAARHLLRRVLLAADGVAVRRAA